MPSDTATPPRPAADRRSGEPPTPAGGPRRRARERSWRRALSIGLLVSVAVHLVLVLLWGPVRLGRWGPEVPEAPRPSPEGLIVLELAEEAAPAERPEAEERVEAEPARPPEERAPTPEPAPERAQPETAGPEAEAPAETEEDEDALSNAERLIPRVGDEGLWVEFDRPVVTERLERYARADSALRAILGEWLDSLRLSEEEWRRARDWTIGEGDERWGISSEGLHLGDITIPIPFGQMLQESGPRAREARRALRELQEIRAQEARRAAEEAARERGEEMRRRSQEEAERRRSDTARDDS